MDQRLRPTPLLLLLLLALLAAPAPARAQYFGRNKVQYRAFDFKVIKTEHFDVHFYPQEEKAALDAARLAERAYGRLSRVLQHEFRERKPIILYASHADFQQTNALQEMIDEGTGGVTEALKNRVIVPFTGSYADFEHVLTHELVHAFQFDVIFRRGVAAEVSPFAARLPLWFMEGMAEYLSIGHIDAHTASWLRDAVMAGYFRTISEMNQRDDYLSYRFGQSLMAYIGSKWGDEVIGVLLQKAPRMGLERAFQSTLGVSLNELGAEWAAEVRRTYLPEVTERTRPTSIAAKLTKHEKLEDPWFLAPAASPDGRYIALLSNHEGFFFDLWLADAKTGEMKKRLIKSSRDGDYESLRYMNSSASFSPDGRLLAFTAQSGGRDALYIVDVERSRVVKQLKFQLNGMANPSWAPDGQRIVFTGLDGGISDLFVTDLEGNLTRLTDDRYADLLPAWSPDGRWIAFTTDRHEGTHFGDLRVGNLRVALYDVERGTIEVLPHQERGKNVNPVWSPDGRSLVWISDRTGVNDLYLYDLERRDLSRITELLSGAIAITPLSPALSWGRDGRLLFVYFENAGYNIYALDDPRSLQRVAVQDLPPEPAATPLAGREPITITQVDVPLDTVRVKGTTVSFYRTGDEFRPSDVLPETARVDAPVSVVALLDSATLALPDTSDFQVVDYSVKLSPDMIGRPTIGAQVGGFYGNGLYGGSYITLSDMLGNHNVVLAGNVNGSFSDAMFLAGYDFLKYRTNFGIIGQQVPFYSYLGGVYGEFMPVRGNMRPVSANLWMRDVIRQAQAIASYPFSTFRRIEAGVGATYYSRDYVYEGFAMDNGEPFRESRSLGSMKFVQPMAALVFDNALFGWTGPIYGRRYRVQASKTFGDFSFTEGLFDLRNYVNYKQKVVLATRLVGLTRFGGDADRFMVYWGGPYYLRGYDGDSFDANECEASRSYTDEQSVSFCPVRDQLIGSSAALMNVELRVPVITELTIGFLGSFPPVDAVAFVDGGVAWQNAVCLAADPFVPDECASGAERDVRLVWDRKRGEDPALVREPLFSYGIGLRINVFYTVLRLDYAWPLNRPDRGGRFSISFGPSF